MLQILTPAATQDLTTLEAAKFELNISGADLDPHVQRLIAQASKLCAQACNRAEGFGRETVRQTEGGLTWDTWHGLRVHSPHLAQDVELARDLAPTILSVTAGGQAIAADYWLLEGSILTRRYVGVLYEGIGWANPLVIEYEAGFDLENGLPADLERACLETIKALWFGRGRDTSIVRTETVGVGMVMYATAAGASQVPPAAAEMLQPYRRISV